MICLWASPETIWERVRAHDHRPLLNEPDPLEKIRELLAAREPYYRQADVLVNTEMRSLREVRSTWCISSTWRRRPIHEGRPSGRGRRSWVSTTAAFTTARAPGIRSAFPPMAGRRAPRRRWPGCAQRGEASRPAASPCRSAERHHPGGELRQSQLLRRPKATDSQTQPAGPTNHRRVTQTGAGNSQSPIANNRYGRVARYARYADYHDVLGERLKQLTQYMNELGGAGTRSLWYVDTGPLLERDLAQRAGWGSSASIPTSSAAGWATGSFFRKSSPRSNWSRTRRRKTAAAPARAASPPVPTPAITAPFQLDARRCISYLTIELKGTIPVELRPGDRQSHLRLRRLPGGLSLEPVCPRRADDEAACAPGAGPAGLAGAARFG